MRDALIFKALAHDTRLRILTLLAARRLCVCHLEAALGLPQVTVSRHLSVLRAVGLVESHREGLWVHYRLAQPRSELEDMLFHWLRSRLRSDKSLRADVARMRECVQMPLEEVAGMVRA
jgi:ArsR family transcriptional regulator